MYFRPKKLGKDGNQKQLFAGSDWEASWDLQPGVQDDAGGGQGRGSGQDVPTCLPVGGEHTPPPTFS